MPKQEIKKDYEVLVSRIPDCDIHWFQKDQTVPAVYDARTKDGRWANVCQECFDEHCYGTGLGRGQKLILDQP